MDRTSSLRCLFAASEVTGFAKTGGLADVAGSLPRALAERGVDIAVIMPLYRCVRTGPTLSNRPILSFTVPLGDRQCRGPIVAFASAGIDGAGLSRRAGGLFRARRPGPGTGPLPVHPGRRRPLRIMPTTAGAMRSFPGPCWRRCGCSIFGPTSCTSTTGRRGSCRSICARSIASRTATNCGGATKSCGRCAPFTISPTRECFPSQDMPVLGLPWRLFNYEALEFYGRVNFLKAGIVFADLLNTVSPMYAREIQTSYFGCGLHGVLLQRTRNLCGIVNGVDYEQWNPADDSFLPAQLRRRQCARRQAGVQGRVCKKPAAWR